jgi:hypothetical protein
MTDTLTPTQVVAAPVGFRLRQLWILFSIFAAPVIFTAGQAVLPQLADDFAGAFAGMIENRDALLASRLLTAAGAFLFVPAIVGIWSLVPSGARGWWLVLVGGIVFAVGTWCNGLSEAVLGYATHAATSGDPEAGSSVVLALDELGLIALPISYFVVIVFGMGVLLLAVGLLVTRAIPIWQPIVLIVGALLSFSFAGMGMLALLTGLPMIASFWGMGVLVARRMKRA